MTKSASPRPLQAAALSLTLALVLAAAPAGAWCIKQCDGDDILWDSNGLTFRCGQKSFPPGPFRDALITAKDRWNQTPGFWTYNLSFGETSVGRDNGENEIWFSTNQDILDGAPGITLKWFSCGELEEADIVFDANWNFTTSTNKSASGAYGGMARTFQTVAVHELGHGLGLCHVNTQYNIMGDDSTHVHANGSTLRAYAGEDGANGLVRLYGIWPPSTFEDVSVSHWRYLGKDGEYSTHQRTRIFNTSNQELEREDWNGEPYFLVNKGQQVKVEFTYENNGRNPHTVAISYVLSTNDLITTGDTQIGTGSISNMARNGVVTTNNTFLTIPSNLVKGQRYWIGAIINYNNAFAEYTSVNNATYIGIKIK